MKNQAVKQSARPLVGPHWCATMGQNISDLVFSAVITQAQQNGGLVTIEQIEKIRRAFDATGSGLQGVYEDNFNACMSCASNDKKPKFERPKLLRFHIAARARSALDKSKIPGVAAWTRKHREIVCRATSDYLSSWSGTSVDDGLFQAYFDRSRSKGRELHASDLLEDPNAQSIVDGFLGRIGKHSEEHPEFAAGLMKLINKKLDSRSLLDPAPAPALDRQDVDALLEALFPAPGPETDQAA